MEIFLQLEFPMILYVYIFISWIFCCLYCSGNETFEKLASMSLIANITVYLRTRYNMDGILLVNVVSIWSGTSNLTAIPGALISDTYLGRFKTLLFGSISSFLVQIFMPNHQNYVNLIRSGM